MICTLCFFFLRYVVVMLSLNRNDWVVVLALIFVPMFFLCPVVSVFAFLFCCSLRNDMQLGRVGLILFLMVLFIYKNNLKGFDSDYEWYFDHYQYWVDGDFLFPFEYNFGLVYAKYSEPLYHLLSYFAANIFLGNKLAFDLVVTLVVYLPAIWAVIKFGQYWEGKEFILLALVVLLTLSINPAMVTQLIRQNIAASILSLALIYLIFGEYRLSGMLLVTSVLTHNSALLVSVVGLSLFLYFVRFDSIASILGAIILCFLVGYFAPYFVASNFYDVFAKDDGAVSLYVYIFDSLFLVACLYYSWRSGQRRLRVMAGMLACYLVFVMATYNSPLLMLRLYHYYDYFRWIPISIVVWSIFGRYPIVAFVFAFVMGCVLIDVRYRMGAFDFDGGFFNIFLLGLVL